MQALNPYRIKRQMLVNTPVKTIRCETAHGSHLWLYFPVFFCFIFLFIHSMCKHTRVVLVSEASLAISFLLSSTCINGNPWGCSSLF